MATYFTERGPASAERFRSIVRPDAFVSRREHARELGRPLAGPLPISPSIQSDFRAAHPEIRSKAEAESRFKAAHAVLALHQQDREVTRHSIRSVRNSREFQQRVRDLSSADPERVAQAGIYFYGSPNPQDWRYAQQRMAA